MKKKWITMLIAVCFSFMAMGALSGCTVSAGCTLISCGVPAVLRENKTYSVSADVRDLNLEINAADLTVVSGEAFSVQSNLKYLSVTEKNGVLTVKETKKFAKNYNGAVLTLTVPEGFVFENAEIETGAGVLTVDVLSAQTLSLELGAGEVKIDELNAIVSATIEGGAGAVTVKSGTLHNLRFEMGVGELNLASAILGESDLEFGVGEANLTLIGAAEDYRLHFEKGLGSITVAGESMSDGSTYGSGTNRIEIEGGVGAAKVSFKAF